ncbi:DUF1801 domain-containing protein [Mucilaginibacter gilvus]|uniref:DUF1801 domain-containing protein n=1 Tax=Mucilaginibacter gilvus TaxID=2305909 RepID=A0A3S3UPE8_9SPHI|nr:DUF1801 domain-containing protein [Mucilaginibacter gilvus]RWY51182.1 DUF1801 domain-containing protein [Mucilaginibacter gilvus]
MYELKTKATPKTAESYLNEVEDEPLRKDCFTIAAMMEKATGEPAIMWGTAIIGCGSYHYKYASGHEGDMCLVGFAPRKANIALYLKLGRFENDELLAQLGKFKMAKSCIYIKKLAHVNLDVLDNMITRSVVLMKAQYPQ